MNKHGLEVLVVVAFFSCKARNSDSKVLLIGGKPAAVGAFPATVMIDSKCTATRVG